MRKIFTDLAEGRKFMANTPIKKDTSKYTGGVISGRGYSMSFAKFNPCAPCCMCYCGGMHKFGDLHVNFFMFDGDPVFRCELVKTAFITQVKLNYDQDVKAHIGFLDYLFEEVVGVKEYHDWGAVYKTTFGNTRAIVMLWCGSNKPDLSKFGYPKETFYNLGNHSFPASDYYLAIIPYQYLRGIKKSFRDIIYGNSVSFVRLKPGYENGEIYGNQQNKYFDLYSCENGLYASACGQRYDNGEYSYVDFPPLLLVQWRLDKYNKYRSSLTHGAYISYQPSEDTEKVFEFSDCQKMPIRGNCVYFSIEKYIAVVFDDASPSINWANSGLIKLLPFAKLTYSNNCSFFSGKWYYTENGKIEYIYLFHDGVKWKLEIHFGVGSYFIDSEDNYRYFDKGIKLTLSGPEIVDAYDVNLMRIESVIDLGENAYPLRAVEMLDRYTIPIAYKEIGPNDTVASFHPTGHDIRPFKYFPRYLYATVQSNMPYIDGMVIQLQKYEEAYDRGTLSTGPFASGYYYYVGTKEAFYFEHGNAPWAVGENGYLSVRFDRDKVKLWIHANSCTSFTSPDSCDDADFPSFSGYSNMLCEWPTIENVKSFQPITSSILSCTLDTTNSLGLRPRNVFYNFVPWSKIREKAPNIPEIITVNLIISE
jgi:hypothetical protein